jgi:hypothetical protein
VRNLFEVLVAPATQPHGEIPHPTASGFGMTSFGKASMIA